MQGSWAEKGEARLDMNNRRLALTTDD